MVNDNTTTIVASESIFFVIITWIRIHFGSKPRNLGSPPRGNSDVNIMNLTIVVSLFVIMIWLINDVLESLIVDTTIIASVQ